MDGVSVLENPPRHGEGNRAQRGGGGYPVLRRPETDAARHLRKTMSLPEVLLWNAVRGAKIGVKVRRQHPIGPYIADFYCSVARLVIEIDGEAHNRANQPARDEMRDRFMVENGYHIMRFAAADVLGNLEGAITEIRSMVDSPLRRFAPPPRAGEDLV